MILYKPDKMAIKQQALEFKTCNIGAHKNNKMMMLKQAKGGHVHLISERTSHKKF